MTSLLSFGHGYCARALTPLLPKDWHIIGTTRTVEKAKELSGEDVEPRIWPGSDLSDDIARATHLLISIAPDETGDPVLNALEQSLNSGKFEWIGYLSTTGVYGDHDGGWVDEMTPLNPSTKRGEHRVLAESQWQEFGKSHGVPLHIFRLAGIYGPGRGPFSKVRNGTARRIIKEGQVFSRIHVADIAQVLAASIAQPNPGAIYNLCDDDPAPPQDVIAYAAELLDVEPPPAVPFEEADLSPMARSFYAESKRVRNDRIKTELGIDLRYPDYKSGLRALLEQEK